VACEGDGKSWLQISAASGGTLTPIRNVEPYQPVDCGTCQAVPYQIGLFCQSLTAAGVTTAWDGSVYQPGTCGPSATACYSVVQAPAGSYVANMCSSTSMGMTMGCVAVPFDYPGPSPVVGTVM
jgi:hypothetical protein